MFLFHRDNSRTNGGLVFQDSHLSMPHVPGMPYEFDYAVNDPAHMAFYSHNANSDGDQVKGEYR